MGNKSLSFVAVIVLSLCVGSFAAQYQHSTAKTLCTQKMGESLSEAKDAVTAYYQDKPPTQDRELMALKDCITLLELNDDVLTQCYGLLTKSSYANNATWSWREASYYKTWATSVMTNKETCLQSLQEANVDPRKYRFTRALLSTSELSGESLSYMNQVPIIGTPGPVKRRRSLLYKRNEPLPDYGRMKKDGFPSWLTRKDRRLLQDDTGVLTGDVVVVSQDGSGNFTTVSEAVAAAPNKTTERFIIYVTAGVYTENVDIPKAKWNIMLIGDGIDVTVITGNRSVIGGFTTFNTATVVAVGQGFLARDITFENTAGPSMHQAVALRTGSDLSAFYKCSFKGYQDTLYVHSLRQYYRECDIYGTVDFIFGNAAVVLQNCNLFARRPMAGQKNLFTAQGRTDPNQNTGISIHNCSILAADDLVPVQAQFKSYLGRPWKLYSRTVYMQSFISDVVDPKGWLEWDGTFALDTLVYREYHNTGPGSLTDNRVTWLGYNKTIDVAEANTYTVENFIVGDAWLPDADVPFTAGLL